MVIDKDENQITPGGISESNFEVAENFFSAADFRNVVPAMAELGKFIF
ncbi:hypothetical protein [Mogibacterium pumilum]|nr:hypothetical protein [Mogibacterium pumilum]